MGITTVLCLAVVTVQQLAPVDVPSHPIRIAKIWVPQRRQIEFVPENEVTELVSEPELDRLVQSYNASIVDGSRRRPVAGRLDAQFELPSGTLRGVATWQIPAVNAERIVFEPWNLSLLRIVDGPPNSQVGMTPGGQLVVTAASRDALSVKMEWQLAPRSRRDGYSYSLRVPPCASAVLDLALPEDWTVRSSSSVELTTDQGARHRLDFNGMKELEFSIVARTTQRQLGASLVAEYRQSCRFDEAGVDCIADMFVRSVRAPIDRVTVNVDSRVRARQVEVSIPAQTRITTAIDERQQLLVELQRGSIGPFQIRLRSRLPVVPDVAWRPPTVSVEQALSRGETIVALISPGWRIAAIEPGQFVASQPGRTAEGYQVTFTGFGPSLDRSDHNETARMPVLTVSPEPRLEVAQHDVTLDLGGDRVRLTGLLDWRCRRGVLQQPTVWLPAGWDVRSVQQLPGGESLAWEVVPQGDRGQLCWTRLAKPLVAGGSTRLQVTAESRDVPDPSLDHPVEYELAEIRPFELPSKTLSTYRVLAPPGIHVNGAKWPAGDSIAVDRPDSDGTELVFSYRAALDRAATIRLTARPPRLAAQFRQSLHWTGSKWSNRAVISLAIRQGVLRGFQLNANRQLPDELNWTISDAANSATMTPLTQSLAENDGATSRSYAVSFAVPVTGEVSLTAEWSAASPLLNVPMLDVSNSEEGSLDVVVSSARAAPISVTASADASLGEWAGTPSDAVWIGRFRPLPTSRLELTAEPATPLDNDMPGYATFYGRAILRPDAALENMTMTIECHRPDSLRIELPEDAQVLECRVDGRGVHADSVGGRLQLPGELTVGQHRVEIATLRRMSRQWGMPVLAVSVPVVDRPVASAIWEIAYPPQWQLRAGREWTRIESASIATTEAADWVASDSANGGELGNGDAASAASAVGRQMLMRERFQLTAASGGPSTTLTLWPRLWIDRASRLATIVGVACALLFGATITTASAKRYLGVALAFAGLATLAGGLVDQTLAWPLWASALAFAAILLHRMRPFSGIPKSAWLIALAWAPHGNAVAQDVEVAAQHVERIPVVIGYDPDAANRSPNMAVVPHPLLKRLRSASSVPRSQVLLQNAQYEGELISPSQVKWKARLVAAVDRVAKVRQLIELPFGNIKPVAITVDGVPTPYTPNANAAGFVFHVEKSGTIHVEVEFLTSILGSGAQREIDFATPPVPLAKWRLDLKDRNISASPDDAAPFVVVRKDGLTILEGSMEPSRRTLIRWREEQRSGTVVRLQRADMMELLDIDRQTIDVYAGVHYVVGSGLVERLELDLAGDLLVRRVDADDLGDDWTIQPVPQTAATAVPGRPRQRLRLHFRTPRTGSFDVRLQCMFNAHSSSAFTAPEIVPLDVAEVSGSLAIRVPAGTLATLGSAENLEPLPVADFLDDWEKFWNVRPDRLALARQFRRSPWRFEVQLARTPPSWSVKQILAVAAGASGLAPAVKNRATVTIRDGAVSMFRFRPPTGVRVHNVAATGLYQWHDDGSTVWLWLDEPVTGEWHCDLDCQLESPAVQRRSSQTVELAMRGFDWIGAEIVESRWSIDPPRGSLAKISDIIGGTAVGPALVESNLPNHAFRVIIEPLDRSATDTTPQKATPQDKHLVRPTHRDGAAASAYVVGVRRCDVQVLPSGGILGVSKWEVLDRSHATLAIRLPEACALYDVRLDGNFVAGSRRDGDTLQLQLYRRAAWQEIAVVWGIAATAAQDSEFALPQLENDDAGRIGVQLAVSDRWAVSVAGDPVDHNEWLCQRFELLVDGLDDWQQHASIRAAQPAPAALSPYLARVECARRELQAAIAAELSQERRAPKAIAATNELTARSQAAVQRRDKSLDRLGIRFDEKTVNDRQWQNELGGAGPSAAAANSYILADRPAPSLIVRQAHTSWSVTNRDRMVRAATALAGLAILFFPVAPVSLRMYWPVALTAGAMTWLHFSGFTLIAVASLALAAVGALANVRDWMEQPVGFGGPSTTRVEPAPAAVVSHGANGHAPSAN